MQKPPPPPQIPKRSTKQQPKLVLLPDNDTISFGTAPQPGRLPLLPLESLRRVSAYATADAYALKDIASRFDFPSKIYDEVLWMDLPNGVDASVFVFDYGVIVFWGLSAFDESVWIEQCRPFATDHLDWDDFEVENLSYVVDVSDSRVYASTDSLLSAARAMDSSLSSQNSLPLLPQVVTLLLPDSLADTSLLGDALPPAAVPIPDDPIPQCPDGGMLFNDVITLRSQSHLIKMTISHPIAQSCKLGIYENMMDETIETTRPFAFRLAQSGQVKLRRSEVVQIMGDLYKLRMDVNLVSNVLDTPEWFWSERAYRGLYDATRVYFELANRIKIINDRTGVISDLLEMLSDHFHTREINYSTWIIIILIAVAIVVALGEVAVKFIKVRGDLVVDMVRVVYGE